MLLIWITKIINSYCNIMVEDRTMDISIGIDDYIVDGKVTSDDMADIIYTHATKLI